jgi:hypothetical protein
MPQEHGFGFEFSGFSPKSDIGGTAYADIIGGLVRRGTSGGLARDTFAANW